MSKTAPPVAYASLPKSTDDYDVELGDVVLGNTNVGLSGSNAQKMVHIGFIRKVYGILSAQLLLTAAIAYACTLGDRMVFLNAWSWAQWPMLFVNLGLLYTTFFFRKKSPLNLMLLAVWTSCMALSIGAVTAVFVEAGETNLIFEAVGITAVMFLSLTVFAFQSKIDFTFMRAGLFMGLHVMILFSLMASLIGFTMPLVYAALGTVLFSFYILYDTSRLIKRFEPDEYVEAAIQLYLDILNLFLYILRMLKKK